MAGENTTFPDTPPMTIPNTRPLLGSGKCSTRTKESEREWNRLLVVSCIIPVFTYYWPFPAILVHPWTDEKTQYAGNDGLDQCVSLDVTCCFGLDGMLCGLVVHHDAHALFFS